MGIPNLGTKSTEHPSSANQVDQGRGPTVRTTLVINVYYGPIFLHIALFVSYALASTPPLPFKIPQIASNSCHEALNRRKGRGPAKTACRSPVRLGLLLI